MGAAPAASACPITLPMGIGRPVRSSPASASPGSRPPACSWWEGDTLVIDTVGYNDKFWFDARGTPHTEQLHTIERWTRINYGTLVNEFTMEDPGAFSEAVQLKFTARLAAPGIDLMEYICTENNQLGIAGGYLPNQESR